jgi:hypothetical protein
MLIKKQEVRKVKKLYNVFTLDSLHPMNFLAKGREKAGNGEEVGGRWEWRGVGRRQGREREGRWHGLGRWREEAGNVGSRYGEGVRRSREMGSGGRRQGMRWGRGREQQGRGRGGRHLSIIFK